MPLTRPSRLAVLVGTLVPPPLVAAPDAAFLRWQLCDVWGRGIAPLTDRKEGSVTLDYDGSRTATVSLSLFDAAAYEVRALTRTLKVWLQDRLIFNGVLLTPAFQGAQGRVRITAVNPVNRLQRSFLHSRMVATGIEQGQLIRNLIEAGEPTPAELALGIPPLGITFGQIDTARTRSRTYEKGQQIWSSVTDLVGLIDGPVVSFEPLDREDGILAECRILNDIGTDRGSAVGFEFGWGRHNCLDMEWTPDGAQVTNRFTAEGPSPAGGGEPNDTPTYTGNSVENQIGVGIYEGWETLSGASEEVDPTEWMQGRAKQMVGAYALPPDYFKIVPANEVLDEGLGRPPLVLTDYDMGDTVEAIGRWGALRRHIRGDVRTIKISEADDAGNLRTELMCVPVVTAAGVT